jgi:tRNA pseudouridine38-40 synthase
MARYKLTIEYDGGPFVGWQRQENGASVQSAIESAVQGFCGEFVTVFGAGRTDAGVHALAQVAHLDLAREVPEETVRDALNFHLKPNPVSILRAERVAEDFDARGDARERRYLYRIANRRAPLAIDRGRAWLVTAPLDEAAMAEAARVLLGKHDFSRFRSVHCQADSPIKTLDALEVVRAGEEIHIAVRARSFLHNQVRIFAGTLKMVGEGKWTPDRVRAALEARDRSAAGPTAPPDGLYLVEVRYGQAGAA